MRRGHALTPETRAKLSVAQRLHRGDPEVWERTMLRANTRTAKAQSRARSEALWRDQAYRAKTLAGIAAYTAQRRAEAEAEVERVFQAALRRVRRGRHEHSRVGHDAT